MITLRELFDKALLALPPVEDRMTLGDLKQGCRFQSRGGVYVFYNIHKEPLYVGISNNIRKRVMEHLSTPKGNKDIVHYIHSGNYVSVEVFYEKDKMYQELYESYLIYQLQPRFNVQKTGREKL